MQARAHVSIALTLSMQAVTVPHTISGGVSLPAGLGSLSSCVMSSHSLTLSSSHGHTVFGVVE